MILRRLADAIRDQSWFTVALEIMIVVIGIFIGLQVDGWNERRKDRSTERDYLERLLVETRLNIKQVTRKAQSYFDRADSLLRQVRHYSQGNKGSGRSRYRHRKHDPAVDVVCRDVATMSFGNQLRHVQSQSQVS